MYSGNSSSSPASTELLLSGEYEIFLSFCGKDTRNGFTDYLYTSLQGAGVRTFRDDNELPVGEEIGPELLKAIKDSKISIPIFSKNYASSKWCLLELTKMVECHAEAKGEKMIFPIFYDVDPYDVRHQSGSYEEAFRQHEKKKRLEVQTVQIWKEALTKVGQLKGFELKKETGGREGELVRRTVEKCLQFLKKNYPHVPTNLVGMDNHIRKLKGLLEVDSNEVRIVGIHGMGGLGKTTMAKIIYNKLCEHFEGHCFLENVRENSRPRDRIVNLQNHVISKIQNRVVPKFDDFNDGSNRIKQAVRGRKVLIVLDDVDENFQVDMLINHSWFGKHSRIIITTRDRDVLRAIEINCQEEGLHDVCTSYKPDDMGDRDSLQLFSKYAFRRDSPMEGYEYLSKEVVSIGAGLPLVLVVLGSMFFGVRDQDLWEEKLSKLREVPMKEVQEKLKISFEALDFAQKQLFLDIACLFIGCNVETPSYMWDDCKFHPREGISVLIYRSLITISDDNKFVMHDHLRDLGRQIVREESMNQLGKQSRLWRGDEALDILETNQGTTSINALCLPWSGPKSPLSASAFHYVPNLRYLRLDYDIDGDFTDLLSNLRWLRWRCSGRFTPTNMLMKNLVTLDLSCSKFTEDWEGWNQIKIGKKLKLLNLSDCQGLRVFPHLSMYSSLEILNLSWCMSICRLDGLEQLTALKDLDASYDDNLETLPSLSNMKKLVKINLEYCTDLIEIQGLEKLESLQDLNITGCESLQRLPDFSNLKDLKTFKASWCEKLAEIKGVHKLNSLEHLDLSECSLLKGVLDMSNLNNIKKFIVPTLEVTNFSNSKELKSLSILLSGNLIRFQVLDRLEELRICSSSMIRLPDLSCLNRLKKLEIRNCNELIEIDLGGLESLEELRIRKCSSVERLLCLSELRKLIWFECLSCKKLTKVQDPDGLESLEKFTIHACPSLVRLPDLRSLKSLTQLKINFLKRLNVIPGLGELKSLHNLYIAKCRSIEALPDFSNLQKLETLNVTDCVSLTKICGLEELKSLCNLYVIGCTGITSLPDLPNTRIHQYPVDWRDSYMADTYMSDTYMFESDMSDTYMSDA